MSMSKNKVIKAAFLCLGLLAVPVSVSHASTITFNNTVDLTAGSGQFVSLPGGPVSIAAGDHVVYNLDFLGNQALWMAGTSAYIYDWLTANDNNSSFTINNISLDLLGFSGTGGASSSYTSLTQSSGAAHIGYALSNFLSSGQSVTFSGLKLEFDVGSIAVTPHNYYQTWLIYGGNDVNVTTTSVPEPATLTLLGLGLAGLGFGRRKSIQA